MSIKISIITPCFNMVNYIEQTLNSILNQNYGNLELIIIDGGSTDGTVEVIKKYKEKITVFISEKDNGQYDAINKGLKMATGDVIAWLNADDIYFPWTFSTISLIFETFSEVNWLIGSFSFLDENGHVTNFYKQNGAKPQKYIANGWFRKSLFGFLQQESMFWRRELMYKGGFLNTNYNLAADFELWTRYAKLTELVALDLPLASFRKRKTSRSKLNEDKYINEVENIISPLKKPVMLRRLLGSKSIMTNHLQRLLTIKKSPICFYSLKDSCWKIENHTRPISNFTILQLLSN